MLYSEEGNHDSRADANVNHDHNASPENIPLTEFKDGNEGGEEAAEGEEPKKKKSRRKEQSVLQAKLTKLAVQIGYVGEIFFYMLAKKRLLYNVRSILKVCFKSVWIRIQKYFILKIPKKHNYFFI